MTPSRASLQRLVILIFLLTLSLAARAYLLLEHHHSVSVAPMHHTPHSGLASHAQTWSVVHFTAVFVAWAVMMTAMMTPSVIPMVLGFIRIRQRTLLRHPYMATVAFLLGHSRPGDHGVEKAGKGIDQPGSKGFGWMR
jgi:predicted metal-binding membrane protein